MYYSQTETQLLLLISDKRSDKDTINDTKLRIQNEFDKYNAYYWITEGKEIENYIAKDAIDKMLGVILEKQCDKYELFPEYIESNYNSFTAKKVPFANKVSEYITYDNSSDIMDLKIQINAIIKIVNSWNTR